MGCAPVMHSVGIQPDDVELECHARGGNVCAGYLYPLCLLQNATIAADTNPDTGAVYVVQIAPGHPGSMFANMKGGTGAVSTDGTAGLYGVAMESFLDEKKGKLKIRGIVRAIVADTGNTEITIGKPLIPVIASVLSTTASILNTAAASVGAGAAPRYVGHVLEANAGTTSTPSVMLVNFDGWNGFGAGNSTS